MVRARLPLYLRLAGRELRGGLKGFRLFLACLAVGVAAIAAVGSISVAVERGLRGDARLLLGGDVHLRLSHRPADDAEYAYIAGAGRLSVSAEMRAMARRNEAHALVELKAIDGTYPLYGAVSLDPPEPLSELLARRDGVWGAVAEPALLARLGVTVGDRLKLGDAELVIRAAIIHEPDRGVSAFRLGPRLMIADGALPATNLVRPGSLVRYNYRIGLPAEISVARWVADLQRAFPDAGWRIRDTRNAAPGVSHFIERIAMFLTLVGLTALLVGGVGVGNAVKAYLDGRIETMATLKCLGAPGRLLFQTYLAQVAVLALAGILVGLLAGAFLPVLAGDVLARFIPLPLRVGLYPAPLINAALFGLLTALAFSIWPVAVAREISPASLFRGLVVPVTR